LEVTLVSRSNRAVARVLTETTNDKELASEVRQSIGERNLDFSDEKTPTDSTFVVDVPYSIRYSGLGFRDRYSQYDVLFLKVEYADGKTHYDVVDIPRGRGRRGMTVEVP
jgi:hypothetical protein